MVHISQSENKLSRQSGKKFQPLKQVIRIRQWQSKGKQFFTGNDSLEIGNCNKVTKIFIDTAQLKMGLRVKKLSY